MKKLLQKRSFFVTSSSASSFPSCITSKKCFTRALTAGVSRNERATHNAKLISARNVMPMITRMPHTAASGR